MDFERPRIVVSACLNFKKCRYDWQKIRNNFIEELEKECDIEIICPEEAIWLWTPRLPIRMINKWWKLILEEIKTDNDYTEKMQTFSERFISKLWQIDWAILKSKSPSCWLWWVKIHNWANWLENLENLRSGFFAKNMIKNYPNIPKEDEWRLLNFKIRNSFLTSIFTIAEFREVKKANNKSSYIAFQSKNKYLFMSLSPALLKKMWQILWWKEFSEKEKEEYENLFFEIINKNWSKPWFINTVEHVYGYFKDRINKDEKNLFLQNMQYFKEWKIPSHVIVSELKMWAERFNEPYLKNQSFLYPYPDTLIDLSDSWKKINI